jgi:hypothetical protein
MIISGKLPPKLIAAAAAKYLSGLWEKSIIDLKRFILSVLVGEAPERKLIEEIIKSLKLKTELVLDQLATKNYVKAMGMRTPPMQPLKELLTNRRIAREPIYKGINTVIFQDIDKAQAIASSGEMATFFEKVAIGRRGQDSIRERALDILENNYLKAGSAKEFKTQFAAEIRSLHPGDPKKFPLEIYPYNGQTRNYNITKYSELVAVTTTNEARTVGFISQAKEMGTPLVKYNSTGEDYSESNDDLCARIDGQVFSIDPNVKEVNGKEVKYLFDVLKGPYVTPHPYCRHHPRPLDPEDF